MTRARIAACALGLAAASCTQIFGMETPGRDPCEDGCLDATADPPVIHAGGTTSPPPNGSTGKHDAAIDVDPPPPPDASSAAPAPDAGPRMIQCGTTSHCNQLTETCCATAPNNNGFVFNCIAQGTTCPGVPISCARQSDCDAPSVCCANNTLQSCVTRGTCNGDLVCDPLLSPSDCPAGTQCMPFQDPSIPYYLCR